MPAPIEVHRDAADETVFHLSRGGEPVGRLFLDESIPLTLGLGHGRVAWTLRMDDGDTCTFTSTRDHPPLASAVAHAQALLDERG